MDGVKGEDYIDYTLKLEFSDKPEDEVVKAITDVKFAEVARFGNCVYFKVI